MEGAEGRQEDVAFLLLLVLDFLILVNRLQLFPLIKISSLTFSIIQCYHHCHMLKHPFLLSHHTILLLFLLILLQLHLLYQQGQFHLLEIFYLSLQSIVTVGKIVRTFKHRNSINY